MDPNSADGRGKNWTTRRGFIATGGAVATLALAGCSDGGDGSTPAGNDQGGQTSTPTSTDKAESQSIEEWRKEMKEKAKKELEGDEKLEVWGQSPPVETTRQHFNGHASEGSLPVEEPPFIEDDGPWAPLKDNVDVVAMGSNKQVEVYRRQVQTNSVKKDVLTSAYLPQLVRQDVPFLDLAENVPSWHKNVPEHLRNLTTKLAYWRGKSANIVYNTKTISEPPKDLGDIFSPRFDDKTIGIDTTPSPYIAYPLVEKYQDEVPPRFKEYGSDMTGSEFLEKLGKQDLKLFRNAWTMVKNTGTGNPDMAFGAPLTGLFAFDDAPLEPMKHPSGNFLRPQAVGLSADPPHPAAAKLFIDYLLSNRGVQLAERGVLSVDYQQSNPEGMADWIMADWQTSYAQLAIDMETKKVRSRWRENLGVPNV